MSKYNAKVSCGVVFYSTFCFLLLLQANCFAQSVKIEDIKTVKNMDSLENNLRPKQPEVYLHQLLVIEASWLKENSDKFGTKLEVIAGLATDQEKRSILSIYYFWKGNLSVKNREHTQAFKFFKDALRLFEKQADSVAVVNTLIKLADLNLNQTTTHLRNIEAGLECASRAVKISELLSGKMLLIKSLSQLITAYRYSGKPAKIILSVIKRQLEIIDDSPDLENLKPTVINNLTDFYTENEEYEKAYTAAKKYQATYKENSTLFLYNVYLLNIASLCLELKKYGEAQSIFNEVGGANDLKELWLIRDFTFKRYRDLYYNAGNFEKALAFADSTIALQGKIYKTENTSKLNKFEGQHKSTNAENENVILVRENELIKNRNYHITIGLIATGLLSAFLITALMFLFRERREVQVKTAEIQRLSSVRDHYIGIIAHDLRSPILAMQGMYEMVRESIKSKRYSDLQRISFYIDKTGVSTRHLLDNLLSWGVTQVDEIPYKPQNLNVAEEISEVLSAYEAVQIINDFSFAVEYSPDLQVYADPDGFQLIIRNLVDNAVKSLPLADGFVELVAFLNADETVTISVRDNGTGMPKPKLGMINKVFANSTHTKISQDGLGLGTALIGRFVQKNKGSIVAHLNSPIGCKFDLTLPRGAFSQ
jgi:signal transduction histidine kinase